LKDVVRTTRLSRLSVVMTPEELRRVLSRMTAAFPDILNTYGGRQSRHLE
jgi:hypothetical protein